MAGALHAYLTPGGQRILLVAAGDDWDKQQIAARISKLTMGWKNAGHPDAVTVPCTWPAVVQLSQSFARTTGLAFVPHDALLDWIADEIAWRAAPPPELERSWPDGLEPRDYQVTAARMIAQNSKFLLLDDMGLGKTVSAILGIEQLRRLGRTIYPMVILVPSWVIGRSWAREIARWMPSWPSPVMYQGPDRTHGAITISTYDTAKIDDRLARLKAPAVIVDEASLVQNAGTARTKATVRIARHASTVVELSGTLFTLDTGGSFAPLKVLDEASWASRERYVSRFLLTWRDEYRENITGLKPETEPELRACLAGQMVRRSKADVRLELPPKVYSVLDPEIPPEWRAAYRQMEQDMLAEVPGNEDEMTAFDTLTKFRRLSQLASSAADVEWTEEIDKKTGEIVKKQKVTLRAPSWKAETLMGIMKVRTAPVIVFTESRQLARITGEDYLRPAGLRFGYVIGTGDGVTDRTKQEAVDDFQAGKLDAIVCTSGAGGMGITLTAADTVVMLQRSPKLDDATQPEDRAHRIGQKAERVHIIDVVARGTVEQRIRELIRIKGGMWAEFARDPGFARQLLGGQS